MKITEPKSFTSTALQSKSNAAPFFQPEESREAFFGSVEHPAPFFNPTPPAGSNPAPATIQAKLTVGAPNDVYEQEADAMAHKVVQKLASDGASVQRKCAECAKDNAEEGIAPKLQKKSIFESNEEPANGQVQRKCKACTAETIQPKRIQRMGSEEEEPALQAKGDVPGLQASSDLESRLNTTKGSGSPLPDDTRSSMESSFGADFSSVRVHTNNSAVQMNQELGAQAFTHGSDIYFNSGKYDTGSSDGQHLLAHELTHTVQQGVQMKAAGYIQLKPIREDYPWPGKIVKNAELWVGPAAESGKSGTLNVGDRVTVMNDLIDCYGVIPEDGTDKSYTLQENIDDLPKLRTDFPWEGIVLNDITLYVGPSKNSGIVKNIIKGTHVTVENELSDYYGVTPKGEKTKGYTLQKNIDDPAASKLATLVGSDMKWNQSSAAGTTDFAKAARDTSKSLPGVAPGTIMNCWEAILLAAYQIGVLDRKRIKELYSSQSNLEGMMATKRGTYEIGKKKQVPQRGEIIYMNNLAHVVLAAGEMDAAGKAVVYSFWPPADFSPAVAKAKLAAGKIDELKNGKIQKTTIEDLADWTINMGLSPHPITFGAPTW